MNALIESLVVLATKVEYGADNGFDCVTLDKEKFAKLLVQECVTVCADLANEYREAAKVQGINNEDQAKALFIAQQRMLAKLGMK